MTNIGNYKHGGHTVNKPEYNSWRAMVYRCTNEKYWAYKHYGGKGVRICDRWLEPAPKGFMNFLEDMGKKPTNKHSIDRVDNTGNYSPENCRWSDQSTQNNNTSRNRFETIKGETKTVAQWCREYGVSIGTIYNRERCGWDFEDALFTPLNKPGANFKNKR